MQATFLKFARVEEVLKLLKIDPDEVKRAIYCRMSSN